MKTPSTPRTYSRQDDLCLGIDQMMRTVFGKPAATTRPYPAKGLVEPTLTATERKHAASLMRVNHAGEVAAQALYQGQRLMSQNQDLQAKLQNAAIEEGEHLQWCATRVTELDSHTSYLNPVWYAGSLLIGMAAGLVGDNWSLGFVAETEQQVVKHLENQLRELPQNDQKSAEVLRQMQLDEAQHRDDAISSGAVILPGWIKKLMGLSAAVMVKTAYWI
ncbi:MAG: 2-polyprenyl-3-methyl-6-methoxy-1,4-benzoquinone monooxygenase [Pseudomonadota bacterium]